jgi:UDP-N-acetylmuramoyl-tripeptide--D-alanyl-D-alanine ligase
MILIVLIIAAVIVKCLDFTYLFQTKEYRADRFRAALHDMGWGSILYTRTPRFPAKSLRNVLIMGICLLEFSILVVALSLTTRETAYVTHLLAFIASPVISLLFVAIGVLLTHPLSMMSRRKLILRATEKAIHSRAQFIGISGTYGKTSTKEYMAQLLSHKFRTAKTDRNMNSEVGVAIAILKNLKEDTEIMVTEVGAYRLHEVERATAIFRPRYAVITAFGNQHLDLFGSKENLVTAESEILKFIPKDGTVYINADLPEFKQVTENLNCTIVTFSTTNRKADIYAVNIKQTENSVTATVHEGENDFEISAPLVGTHVIANLLPAIAFARHRGMTVKEIQKAIASLTPIEGKLSAHHNSRGTTVLNDTGNSSVEGFLAALNATKPFPQPNKIIATRGIIELGNEKKSSYNRILDTLDTTDVSLVTTDRLLTRPGSKTSYFASEKELQKHLVDAQNSDTLLILEGRFRKSFIKEIIQ